METTKHSPLNLITQRKPEELEAIKKECINFLLHEDFIILNSPMGILLVDKLHSDFKEIVKQCIIYVKLFGDKESEQKYLELIN